MNLRKSLGLVLAGLIAASTVSAQTTPSVITMHDAATATGNGTALVVSVSAAAPNSALGAVGVQITGTFSATITFEATTDGTNWTAVMATELADDSRATTATAAGHYTIIYGSAIRVRARISSYSSGSVTVKARLIPGLTARLTSGGGGGGSGTVTSVAFTGGLITVTDPTTAAALTVAGTSGGVPYFSSASTWASSGVLAANALVIGGGAGAAPATTTTGTGVVTALGVNVGSAGAFVTFNGALGTPSSGVLTNATGLPPTTGIVGWPANASGALTNDGAGVLSWAAAGGSPAGSGTEIQVRAGASTFGAVTGSSSANGTITLVGQAVAGGDSLLDLTPAAHTAVTTETPDTIVRAHTNATTATIATWRFNQFLAPTLTADTGRTTTTAATLYVDAAPVAGSNITITNPLSLWVDSGNTRLDGFLAIGTNPIATTQFYVQAQSSGNVGAIIEGSSGATVNLFEVQRGSTDQFVISSVGRALFTPNTSSATTPRVNFIAALDTGMTASTEAPFMRFGGDSSGVTVSRQWGTGALTTQREHLFIAPTIAFVAASTCTTCATVAIDAAPIAGANATITTPAALWIQSGLTKLDGNVTTTGTITQTSASATAFESGPNGGTNPVFRLVNSTASAATGISITGAAAASGVAIASLSSGSNEPIAIIPKGTGGISFGAASAGTAQVIRLTQSGNAGIGLGLFGNGEQRLSFGPDGIGLNSALTLWWTSSATDGNGTRDLLMRRSAAANLAFGAADAASPVAQTTSVQNVVTGTTNTAGATRTYQASLGTSQGAPGRQHFTGGAMIAASGTTVQTAVDRLISGATKVLTNNSAITIVNVTAAANAVAGGQLGYLVEVTDGTDVAYETGVVSFGVSNKAGAFTGNTATKFGNHQDATGGSTLTVTFAISGANPALLSVNANSSLTPSTGYPRITYWLMNGAQQAVAVQ